VLQSPFRSLTGSVLLHGGLVLLLFSLNFSGTRLPSPLPIGRVILIAPPAPKSHRLIRPSAVHTSATRIASAVQPLPKSPHRDFHAPALPPIRAAAAPLIPTSAPVHLELPQLTPELTQPSIAIARRPLKTDNFAESSKIEPAAAPVQIVKSAGFASIETSAQAATRGKVSGGGTFDTPALVKSVTPRDTGTVRAGFGDATTGAAAVKPRTTAAVSSLTSVEILFKPRPAYTDEARRLQIQGEVLLEILFGASGEARVQRVMHGLGHGLDETAAAAAREIRFRPARRDGTPVDYQATVHIIFELAN